MNERRRVPRWKITHECKLQIEGEDDRCSCQVFDLNLKGAKLISASLLKLASPAKLILYLDAGCTIKPEAEIAWHEAAGGRHIYGFKFHKITDADKEKIFRFMRGTYLDQFNQMTWKV